MHQDNIIPVDLIALVEDQDSSAPIVLLQDSKTNRLLPVWIGEAEARAISFALERVTVPRPLTHKLLLNVIGEIGGELMHIVIDRLVRNTYYSSIYLDVSGKIVQVDARPSDAIALAIEAHAPIFVAKKIMEEAGQANSLSSSPATVKKKISFSEEDLKKIRELLERAREREKKSSQ